jgi:preprotein translocase subunit SecF
VWGILIGTYSSIFVAASLLLYMPAVSQSVAQEERTPETASAPR